MNYIKLRKYFQAALIFVVLVLIWGCGSGGGSANEVVRKTPSASITSVSASEYVVRGVNMDGVAGIELTITYDSSILSSPVVTQGALISGALMAANTGTPGTIKIAIVSKNAFSGSDQIATIAFTASPGTGNVSITSVSMIDIHGAPIQ